MRYIPIVFDNSIPAFKSLNETAKISVFDGKHTWQEFAELINKKVDGTNASGLVVSEDKKLGPFFVNESDVSSKQSFCDKVIYYLKNDVFKYDSKKEKIEFRGAWAIVAIVLFLFLAMYFWEILEFASKYINSNFINKMLKLRAEQNVSNNREDLYTLSFNLIPNHPIFGHGISSFAFYTGEVYPHNLFVQLLFDGGIVLFLLVAIPLLSLVLNLFKKCDFELVPIFTFLFSK